MLVSEIQLYQILKQRLGEKEAEALVQYVDSKLRENNEQNLKILATKEDLAKVEGKLETKIAESKVDIIKWMFIFWASQIAITITLVKLFVN